MPLVCDMPMDFPTGHAPDCRCCGPVAPALWAVYGAMRATGCTDVARVMKADGATTDPDARPEEDPTLTEELLLAALLAAAVMGVAEKVLARFWRTVARDFSEETVASALAKATTASRKALTRKQQDEVGRIIERGMANGALDAALDETPAPEARVGMRPERPEVPPATGRLTVENVGVGTTLADDAEAGAAWDRTTRTTIEAANSYFEEVIAPTIQRQLDPLLEQAREVAARGEAFALDLTEVRALIDAQVSQTSRWRVVANASVSRAYHYGFLRGSDMGGATTYTWVTVGDERVCAICDELGGRVFRVRSALDLMQQVTESDDADAVKMILPWAKSVEDVRSRATMVPPAHGRCRCTIRVNAAG